MKEFSPQNFNVRCSAIHAVMANSRSNPTLTEKQAERLTELEDKVLLTPKMQEEMAELLIKKENGKKVILSDTCIAYLMEEYAWQTQGMIRLSKELLDIPQMRKGIAVEQDSLDLLCVVDGVVYKENKDEDGNRPRLYNEFLSGEIDAYVGENATAASIVPDIKSIYDYPTFLSKIHESLTIANDWQLKGYSDLTGAKDVFVANCLVDADFATIEAVKWQLLRKLAGSAATDESPVFKEKWEIVERSMKFNHMPAHQRVFKKKVEPMSETQRQAVYDRVKVCREWLAIFHETYENLNK